MNVRKTLHAGLTLTLLILAVYLLHWQETGLKQVYTRPAAANASINVSNPNINTVCCLEHALEAVEKDAAAPYLMVSFKKMVQRKQLGNKLTDSAAHHLASVSVDDTFLTN